MYTCSRPISQRSLRCSLTFALASLPSAGLLELLFKPAIFFWCFRMTSMRPTVCANARLQNLFGQLLLVEGDDFLDVADAAAQVFAQPDDLANHDRRTRDRLHHANLSALDALGDLDLALAGEQRHRTHLAQVHAHGVIRLLKRAGREVELDVFGLFAGLGLVLVAVAALAVAAKLDALRVDGRQQVVQVIGRGDFAGQQVVDLAKREITLLLAIPLQFRLRTYPARRPRFYALLPVSTL